MSVMSAKMIWSEDTEPVLTYISLSKIKEWAYTENGNFCYELCVPEPPEVTEIVDGSCIIRVKPLSEECREYSKKYVSTFGYQGNNLLCSNWNAEDMQGLDYNGLYEYFKEKCQEAFGKVECGSFGADMKVDLENDGPFTILWDSDWW